ncbi:MAG: ERF family protein [bacterium]|nr:ERF family protein [bacterium]
MLKSENVTELSAALAKAQAGIANAAKEGTNTHYSSSYATLKSVWAVCKTPLTENGLSVVQSPEFDGQSVKVTTTLLHKTGQWIESAITMPVKKIDCQGIGSAITYARRYALAAMVGVAPDDDDDGEAAVNHHQRPPQQNQRQQSAPAEQIQGRANRPQEAQGSPPAQQQQQPQGEPTNYQRVRSFLQAAGCQSQEAAELVIDFVVPGQTLETIKNEEIAAFTLSNITEKLKGGIFTPETVLDLARKTKAAADAFK